MRQTRYNFQKHAFYFNFSTTILFNFLCIIRIYTHYWIKVRNIQCLSVIYRKCRKIWFYTVSYHECGPFKTVLWYFINLRQFIKEKRTTVVGIRLIKISVSQYSSCCLSLMMVDMRTVQGRMRRRRGLVLLAYLSTSWHKRNKLSLLFFSIAAFSDKNQLFFFKGKKNV